MEFHTHSFLSLDEMEDSLTVTLEKLQKKKISIEEAKEMIGRLHVREIGNIARLDILRIYRTGIPEVVLAEGKESRDVVRLLIELARENNQALATRVKDEDIKMLRKNLPQDLSLFFKKEARAVIVRRKNFLPEKKGMVGVLAAGTADIPVAEEACITLDVMGCKYMKAYDVGIAGIHRLFDPLEKMVKKVDVFIVVAGMEGVLPSIVAGLVGVPVIGVPTSIGYGVGAGGKVALHTMLQSCSPGLAVVNIDNGFGAGVIAGLIARASAKSSSLRSR